MNGTQASQLPPRVGDTLRLERGVEVATASVVRVTDTQVAGVLADNATVVRVSRKTGREIGGNWVWKR